MYKKNITYNGSVSPDLGNQKIFYIIVLAGVLLAVLFGLFAVTANPIVISLAVALIAGTVLLIHPVWIIWLILSLGLLVTGLLPLYFDSFASKATWGVSLLGFLLMLIALTKVAMSPSARKGTPTFVWIALCFLVYALLNSILQWHSMGEIFGGFKRYFQMWGILFALCWLAFDEIEIRRWRMFFVILSLVQLPFVVYELIVFVPLREGLRNSFPFMVPIDVVAGTFGASRTGGGSSPEMAIFLIITLTFLLAHRMENNLSINKLFLVFPFVLLPLFLGETKAVIIMLPLMFLVLYRHQMLARLHYWLMGLIFITLLAISAGYTYLSMSNKSMDEQIESTLSYNIGDVGYGGNYLNRTTALTFWAERQGIHDPISLVFGNGLGSSHAMGGHVDKRYLTYGIGLTSASTLLWDLGVFGFGLYIAILVLAWHCAARLRRESSLIEVKADAAAIQTSLVLFGFFLFYRIGLLENISLQIVFTVLLGYLAWLYREHVLAMTDIRT